VSRVQLIALRVGSTPLVASPRFNELSTRLGIGSVQETLILRDAVSKPLKACVPLLDRRGEKRIIGVIADIGSGDP
jgi:hypothetical protein